MTGGDVSAPCDLDATGMLALIRARAISAEDLVRCCLDRIEARDAEIRAFVSLDADAALDAARRLDSAPTRAGPLHGLPFGVKDVIDVAGMATRFGSDLPIGRIAGDDAAVVALMRRAGAIVLGKTETVEFAALGRIPPTRNPRDFERSPGGSSSGSAAAVAAGMVPFALGTQTGGSLVRPASYVGVHTLKPSHGLLSLYGVHPHAPSFDCVGWHARSVADLALIASVFRLPPARKPPATGPGALRIAICRTPDADELDADSRSIFEQSIAKLAAAGIELCEMVLPPLFDGLSAAHFTIMRAEARASFRHWHELWPDRMHPLLQAIFDAEPDAAAGDVADRMADAHRLAAECRSAFAGLVRPFDAVIAPAATGAAPLLAEGTGSPAMNRMWTALQVPIVALPAGLTGNGLPIGCQLIGGLYGDHDLLQTAAIVDGILASNDPT